MLYTGEKKRMSSIQHRLRATAQSSCSVGGPFVDGSSDAGEQKKKEGFLLLLFAHLPNEGRQQQNSLSPYLKEN